MFSNSAWDIANERGKTTTGRKKGWQAIEAGSGAGFFPKDISR
jgi:hypothetical protein